MVSNTYRKVTTFTSIHLSAKSKNVELCKPYLEVYKYLVESGESLLLVQLSRKWPCSSVSQIMVHEVNLSDGTMARVKSLGDRALFLGQKSSSFSEANRIYVADSSREWLKSFSIRDDDSGIFRLKLLDELGYTSFACTSVGSAYYSMNSIEKTKQHY